MKIFFEIIPTSHSKLSKIKPHSGNAITVPKLLPTYVQDINIDFSCSGTHLKIFF